MKALFDTNILIDYLNGKDEAAKALAKCSERFISRITWMEVLAGVPADGDEAATREFLGCFDMAELTPAISEAAVAIRRGHPIKLPDAIILATARQLGCDLVTRDSKAFDPEWPDIRIPYK